VARASHSRVTVHGACLGGFVRRSEVEICAGASALDRSVSSEALEARFDGASTAASVSFNHVGVVTGLDTKLSAIAADRAARNAGVGR
jgi:hypothetical protein